MCRCMRGVLTWTCLVWAERTTPDNFWMSNHRLNSATGEQKGFTQTIYTDSKPPSRMPNSLMPSAKLEAQTSHFLRLWCDAVGDRTPASRTASGRSNHYATRGHWITSSNPVWSIFIFHLIDRVLLDQVSLVQKTGLKPNISWLLDICMNREIYS